MADIFDLISRRNKKKRQLREYETRLKNLRKFNDVGDVFDRIANSINDSYNGINYNTTVGMEGIPLRDNVIGDLFYEKSFLQDPHLRNIDGELQSEIRRCIRKIDDLEDDIRSLNNRIDRAREEDSE